MILRSLIITDFGIYGGQNQFELNPIAVDNYQRPVVLFRGKNGVGKTTFVEAIRLALHGPLAIGNRVGQREFEDYLTQAIHHSPNGHHPSCASVELEFEYVHAAKRHIYRVQREWQRINNRVEHELRIWEDGVQVDLSRDLDSNEMFLRELVPPGLADLFFFDGERIEALASEGPESNILLADTVKTLLGLDLVEQLGKDLDIFLTRKQSEDDDTEILIEELEALIAQENELQQQYDVTQNEMRRIDSNLMELRRRVTEQQQRIAMEGGQFAAERDQKLAEKNRLEATIEHKRRQVQELCAGLMPFAISPNLLDAVAKRLQDEKTVQESRVVDDAISERVSELRRMIRSDAFWSDVGLSAKVAAREQLLARITDLLEGDRLQTETLGESLIFDFSDRERELLLSWINQVEREIPRQFSALVQELAAFERQLKSINRALEMVPADETLGPLVNELNQLHSKIATFHLQHDKLEEEIQRLIFHLERTASRKEKVREEIRAGHADDHRVQLAIKTQKALFAYQSLLTEKKITELERLLVRRFNQLCRKKTFLDRVEIDRTTYVITPHRLGKRFSRDQLSAGEQQLFAIATLWALREVSGRPVPIIIDTPLSRLDTDHRTSLVQEFIPHSSHQVIVLGTDYELDQEIVRQLSPAISRVYEMEFDTTAGATRFKHESPGRMSSTDNLIQLQEVNIR